MAYAFDLPKPFKMSEQIKGYLSKETLIPISFALALVWPVIHIVQLGAKVDTLESKLELLEENSVRKDIFEIKMNTFDEKLDRILKVVETPKE